MIKKVLNLTRGMTFQYNGRVVKIISFPTRTSVILQPLKMKPGEPSLEKVTTKEIEGRLFWEV